MNHSLLIFQDFIPTSNLLSSLELTTGGRKSFFSLVKRGGGGGGGVADLLLTILNSCNKHFFLLSLSNSRQTFAINGVPRGFPDFDLYLYGFCLISQWRLMVPHTIIDLPLIQILYPLNLAKYRSYSLKFGRIQILSSHTDFLPKILIFSRKY